MFFTDSVEIKQITTQLTSKNSAGVDDISINLLKYSIEFIAEPLSKIINCSFDTGIFPDKLKIAKVCPIFKSGDKDIISNYRPISILPSFSKFFEKLVYIPFA